MVEDVIDEETLLVDVDEGAGRDATNDSLMDDIEEWAWFRKPFFAGSFTNGTGSVGGASIRSEAFI